MKCCCKSPPEEEIRAWKEMRKVLTWLKVSIWHQLGNNNSIECRKVIMGTHHEKMFLCNLFLFFSISSRIDDLNGLNLEKYNDEYMIAAWLLLTLSALFCARASTHRGWRRNTLMSPQEDSKVKVPILERWHLLGFNLVLRSEKRGTKTAPQTVRDTTWLSASMCHLGFWVTCLSAGIHLAKCTQWSLIQVTSRTVRGTIFLSTEQTPLWHYYFWLLFF